MYVSVPQPDGSSKVYSATLRFPIEGSSWSTLECNRREYFEKVGLVRALFLSAVDLPIAGCENWFKISNHPVEISRHTEGRTYTALTMEAMEVGRL